jgi:hypothetical protein
MQFPVRTVRTALATLLVVLSACGVDDIINTQYEPQVVNSTDDFSFQATGFLDVTDTRQYTWQNTGTTASVDRSSLIVSGNGTLTILDANSTEVYSAPLVSGGTVVTSAGTAGAWTIRVALTSSSGAINFRAQRGT